LVIGSVSHEGEKKEIAASSPQEGVDLGRRKDLPNACNLTQPFSQARATYFLWKVISQQPRSKG